MNGGLEPGGDVGRRPRRRDRPPSARRGCRRGGQCPGRGGHGQDRRHQGRADNANEGPGRARGRPPGRACPGGTSTEAARAASAHEVAWSGGLGAVGQHEGVASLEVIFGTHWGFFPRPNSGRRLSVDRPRPSCSGGTGRSRGQTRTFGPTTTLALSTLASAIGVAGAASRQRRDPGFGWPKNAGRARTASFRLGRPGQPLFLGRRARRQEPTAVPR